MHLLSYHERKRNVETMKECLTHLGIPTSPYGTTILHCPKALEFIFEAMKFFGWIDECGFFKTGIWYPKKSTMRFWVKKNERVR